MNTPASRAFLQALLLFFCAATAVVAQKSQSPAETIVLHGKLYTLDDKNPWAQALAIRGDKIIAVGTDAAVEKFRGPATKVIDA